MLWLCNNIKPSEVAVSGGTLNSTPRRVSPASFKFSHERSEKWPSEIGRATFELRRLVEATVLQQTQRARVQLAVGQLAALLLHCRDKVVSESAIIAAADVRVG